MTEDELNAQQVARVVINRMDFINYVINEIIHDDIPAEDNPNLVELINSLQGAANTAKEYCQTIAYRKEFNGEIENDNHQD